MKETGIADRKDMSKEQKTWLRALFKKYYPVWDGVLRKAGPTVTKIKPTRIVYTRGRRPSNPDRLKDFHEYIMMLAKQGSIRPSSSPFSSPAFLVPKPHRNLPPDAPISKRYRLVVDYVALNEVCIKDRYKPPRIADCIRTLWNSKVRSFFDLEQAFLQVPLLAHGLLRTA